MPLRRHTRRHTHTSNEDSISAIHCIHLTEIKRLKVCIALHGNPSQSCEASLAIWDHSATCHPIHVNAPRLNPSQTGRYSIYLSRRDGRLSWSRWLVTYQDGLPICRQSPIYVVIVHRRRASSLIKTNAFTTIPRCHGDVVSATNSKE